MSDFFSVVLIYFLLITCKLFDEHVPFKIQFMVKKSRKWHT